MYYNFIAFMEKKKFISIMLNKEFFFVIILLIIFSTMRLIFLRADPPAKHFMCYGVYLTDEGYRVTSARDRALFDLKYETIYKFNKTVATSIVIHFIYYVIFKIFGVGYLQIRIVPAILSIFSLIIFYLIVRKYFTLYQSLIIFFLFGINHIFLFYNRLGLMETFLVFFVLIPIFILFYSENWKPFFHIFPGISFALALFVKPHAIPFIIVYLLILFIFNKNNLKIFLIKSAYFLSGLFIIVLIFVSYIYITKSQFLFIESLSREVEARIFSGFKNLFNNFAFFPPLYYVRLSPLSFYLCILLYFTLILKLIQDYRNINIFEYLIIFLLPLQVFSIAFVKYQPIRYFISMIIPVSIGLGILSLQKYEFLSGKKELLLKSILIFFITLFTSIGAMFIFFPKTDKIFKVVRDIYISLDYYIIAACISFIFSIVNFLINYKIWIKYKKLKTLVIVSTFFISFFICFVILKDIPLILKGVLKILPIWYFFNYNLIISGIISILLIPLFFILNSNLPAVELKTNLRFNRLFLVLVLVTTLWDIYPYYRWIRNIDYSVYNASKEIGNLTQNKGVIFSRAATSLAIENNLMAVNNLNFLLDLVPYFKIRKIPIYILFTRIQEFEDFYKKNEYFLVSMGIKQIVMIKDFLLLQNYDRESDCCLYYLEFVY